MSRRDTPSGSWTEHEPIDEVLHLYSDVTPDEVRQALFALCDHLGLTVRRTNNTKHGDLQIQIVDPTEGL